MENAGKGISERISAALGELVQLAPPASVWQLHEAEQVLDMKIPLELSELLQICNGIEERMIVHGATITVGWILYPLQEIVARTQLFQTTYHKSGIFFSDDGTGDPFYLTGTGAVRHFHPIADEDEVIALSLAAFYWEYLHPKQK